MLQQCSRLRACSRSGGRFRTWCYTASRSACSCDACGVIRARARSALARGPASCTSRVCAQVVESKLWTICREPRACARSRRALRRFESGRKSRCVSSSACNRSAAVIRCCPIMQRSHDGRREAMRSLQRGPRIKLAGSRGTQLAYAVEAHASGETFSLAAPSLVTLPLAAGSFAAPAFVVLPLEMRP